MLRNKETYIDGREGYVCSAADIRITKTKKNELNFFELFFVCTVATASFFTLFAFLF